jgi:hypothetical protein
MVEPEGSLLSSQDPVSGPGPRTDEPIPSFFKISLSIIPSHMPRASKWFPLFWFFD